MPFLTTSERDELKARFSDSAREAFDEIIKSYKIDLSTNTQGYFSQEDQSCIWREAGEKFRARLLQSSGEIQRPDVLEAWQKTVEDFYHNEFWGYKTHLGSAPKFDWEEKDLEAVEIEEKKLNAILKEARPYIIRFFVGLVIWKMVILFLAQNGFFDWWGDN